MHSHDLFQNKAFQDELSELTRGRVVSIKVQPVSGGYSRAVLIFQTHSSHGVRKKFVAKMSNDDRDFKFYEDVLSPFSLNSPRMFGIVRGYTVMEYVSEIENLSEKDKYFILLDWLVRKDQIFREHASLIKKTGSVRQNMNDGSTWWPIIEECIQQKLNPIINQTFAMRITEYRKLLAKSIEYLSQGPETLCHNDLQLGNILVNSKKSVYVIDWTNPCIGSSLTDLSRLTILEPKFRSRFIERYRKSFAIDNFDALLSLAEFRSRLSIFTWMCKALNENRLQDIEKHYNVKKWLSGLENSLNLVEAVTI